MLKKIVGLVMVLLLFTAMTVQAKDDQPNLSAEFVMPVIHSQF